MNADEYWRTPFNPLQTPQQLLEFVVLDVESVPGKADQRTSRYLLADVQVTRVSDFGRNDVIFSITTHLGHLLKPGDHALGCDLSGANFNDDEAEKQRVSLPDVVLIKKKYEGKRRNRHRQGAPGGRVQQQNRDPIYVQFLRDLEENHESRFNASIHHGDERESSSTTSTPQHSRRILNLHCKMSLHETPEST